MAAQEEIVAGDAADNIRRTIEANFEPIIERVARDQLQWILGSIAVATALTIAVLGFLIRSR